MTVGPFTAGSGITLTIQEYMNRSSDIVRKGGMGHGADDKNLAIPRERPDAAGATDVASTLQALATPSRLYILARFQEGPCAVGERQGRSIVYALYGHHVAELLEQALFHAEHLRLGLRDTPTERIEALVR